MTRPVFTASEVDRVKTCLASAVLPRTRETTPGQAIGTAKHRFLERCNTIGRDAALNEIQDATLADMFAAINLDGLPLDPSAWVAELALCWDFETGQARELGRGVNRQYRGVGPTEIPSTADSAALVGWDGVAISDYKPEFGHQPPAREHGQLRLLALMMVRAFGREWARVDICRPRRDEKAWTDSDRLDLFDLAEIAEETRALALAVVQARLEYEADGVIPEPHVGEWCKRCPCVAACPAQGGLLVQLSGGDMVDRFASALTPATAATAWQRLQAIRSLVEKLEGAMETYAQTHPIDLGDGRIVGPQRVRRESLDGAKTWRVLEALFGEESAWEGTEIKATKAGLERLVRNNNAAKGSGKISHFMRMVLDRVAEDGGVHVLVTDQVRVHRAPKELDK